jgi:hypothetical protein
MHRDFSGWDIINYSRLLIFYNQGYFGGLFLCRACFSSHIALVLVSQTMDPKAPGFPPLSVIWVMPKPGSFTPVGYIYDSAPVTCVLGHEVCYDPCPNIDEYCHLGGITVHQDDNV